MSAASEAQMRLYKAMLRVRRVEEILAEEYRKGTMRTPTHFGIGQEAPAVGVCEALERSDVVYSHHRCHTHYLAKGGSLSGLVGELLGRESGCSRGRGGSVHLTDRAVGFLGSSPILGQATALATGSALAFKMDGKQSVAVAFFGEGAFDEGSVYESFNFASVHKLPVLYVCENNIYATESPLSVRQADGTDLCDRVRSFKIEARHIDGNDILAVLDAAKSAVERCRSGRGPFFLECDTYRWREHVGPLWDDEAKRTYRTKQEVEAWMQKCPIKRFGAHLVAAKLAAPGQFAAWRVTIDKEIHDALEAGKASPWPQVDSLFENIV